jgi:hypothetical protein
MEGAPDLNMIEVRAEMLTQILKQQGFLEGKR